MYVITLFYTFFRPILDNVHVIRYKCNQFRHCGCRIMPDRSGPPNCRTAEIACTISEIHALSPKLAGKRCISVIHHHFTHTARAASIRPLTKKKQGVPILSHFSILFNLHLQAYIHHQILINPPLHRLGAAPLVFPECFLNHCTNRDEAIYASSRFLQWLGGQKVLL